MLDQLKIGEKASLDFGASVAERTIGQPKKKEIKETIPFSNITYDFSKINGELYWEERPLDYVFEILADTPAELEDKKIAFANWIMNTFNEEIIDPFICGYHFKGTFSDLKFADEENVEKTTATVSFKVYPYKIADEAKVYKQTIATGDTVTMNVENNSSHRLTPTLIVEGGVAITLNNVTYTAANGTYTDDTLKIEVGMNALEVTNTGEEEAVLTITFYEEVF